MSLFEPTDYICYLYQLSCKIIQVSTRLRRHEFTTGEGEHIFGLAGPVKAVDINKLRSNIPIEDAHANGVADLGDRKAILFSVIDGHGGPTCGQVSQSVSQSGGHRDYYKLHQRNVKSQDRQALIKSVFTHNISGGCNYAMSTNPGMNQPMRSIHFSLDW